MVVGPWGGRLQRELAACRLDWQIQLELLGRDAGEPCDQLLPARARNRIGGHAARRWVAQLVERKDVELRAQLGRTSAGFLDS